MEDSSGQSKLKGEKEQGSQTGQWEQYGLKSTTTPGKHEGRVPNNPSPGHGKKGNIYPLLGHRTK